MDVFLWTMGTGLSGLGLMAIPGLRRHGAGMHGAGKLHGHVGKLGAGKLHASVGAHHAVGVHHAPASPHAAGTLAKSTSRALAHGADGTASALSRFVPEPRIILSLLALFGAAGNLLTHLHLGFWLAAAAAAAAAIAVDRFAVEPVWRLALGFQGRPTSALTALLMEEARAVTAFRNGRGMVSVIRDGRAVQFHARVLPGEAEIPIKVGDRLRVQDVDLATEQLTVSHVGV